MKRVWANSTVLSAGVVVALAMAGTVGGPAAAQTPANSTVPTSQATSTLTPAPGSTGLPRATVPAPPTSVATPSPIGTPWPAPPEFRLEQRVDILDADNVPIHPDNRTTTLVLSWTRQSGFFGNYEFQWWHGAPGAAHAFGFLGIFDADQTRFEVPVQFNEWLNSQFCFRVRAFTLRPGTPFSGVVDSTEAGPFSSEVCSVRPIVDGPRPPTVGSGQMAEGNGARHPRLFLGAAALALVTGALAVLTRWAITGRERSTRTHRW